MDHFKALWALSKSGVRWPSLRSSPGPIWCPPRIGPRAGPFSHFYQDDLNSLTQWETDWQMKFNVAKCHSMRVTRHPPDKHIQFDYTLHQQRLEHFQSAKYPGLTITDQHISEISARQLRQCVFFCAIWPLHLGTLRKLHTKHWFALSSTMQHLFGIPIMNLRLDRLRRCRGQLPGGPAGDGGTTVGSAICLTALSGHPWRPAGCSLP